MAEGLSPQLAQEADRLYWQHTDNGKAVDHYQELIDQTKTKEAKIAEVGIDNIDLQALGGYSANEMLSRQAMLHDAQKSRDAELWRAHEHYQNNREAYEEQARIDAEAAGKEIKLPPVA